VAKSTIIVDAGRLNEGGRLYFLLTIYSKKSLITWVLDHAKPYLKYLTTVDFGRMTYENEFEELLERNKLRIVDKQRVQNRYNILLKAFKFFVFEAEVMGRDTRLQTSSA
jgi:hypothetical protein